MTGIRPNVIDAKQRLAAGREKLKARHHKGSPGIQVCRALTELFDAVVMELVGAALVELNETGPDGLMSKIALVPHGGYGRGDVAPYSDVDLMILHEPRTAARLGPLVERIVRDVFDVGLTLGHSVRTVQDACRLSRGDATICTSLVESRFLAGNQELYVRYARSFLRATTRRSTRLMSTIDEARRDERAQYGETVYLLEPNVKRSPGGLRDLQLIRWIGYVRYGMADPDGLRSMGNLSYVDHDAVLRAREFLLRLRNEMHFHSEKSADVLDRAEQVRLAEVFGYRGTEGLLPVEQFMREYFRMTNKTSHVARRFLANARPHRWWSSWLAPLVSHQFDGMFVVGPLQISVTRRSLPKFGRDLSAILHLAEMANIYNKPIAHTTWEAIRGAIPNLPEQVSPEAAGRFRSLMNQPARLGELLRTLHEVGVLEKVIPAFDHARSLLQFNVYHKYTVDEHCLLAVSMATQFARDAGPLGSVYRHLKRKWLLHLALLLHDLGKGFAEDHSEVGLRIAGETGPRLHLQPEETETLKFLVHKHLMMSHLAFRRDTSDADLIVRFAFDVGSPERLEMLYLLSAADLAAVGPGVLNAWKVEVLTDLFHNTRQHLGGDDPTGDYEARLNERREQVLSLIGADDDATWFENQVDALPAPYLSMTPPTVVADDLRSLRALQPSDAIARGRYLSDTNTVEYSVGTYETIAPGVFHKLTGALTSQGLQILSAGINTLADGLVLDRFHVQDPDFQGEPPPERINDVCRALVAALHSQSDKPPVFRRLWRPAEQRRQASLSPLPTQVRIDNNTSDRFTIIDVFAADRMGLLYAITRALFELGLSVAVAKIGTYLDQVVDVFYVTDLQGEKVDDEIRFPAIRQRLFDEIDELQRQEATQGQRW